jgi:acyl-coenzyme A synthetase/AMP-(fatty) acid ligase
VGYRSLANVFDDLRPPQLPVAIDGGRTFSFEQFARSVASVASMAEEAGAGRWLLASEDAWSFIVGFFGLLRAGCTISIPPNHLPATLERLLPGMDGGLTDLIPPSLNPADLSEVGWGHPWHRIPGAAEALPDRAPLKDSVIEFWTSGSTGEAKCIRKHLSQLDAEVEILEKTFGARFEGGPVLGTVPHQHIYGCLFRILWPLAAGRPIIIEQCADPIRFRSAMMRSQAPALVSSPALLARLPDLVDLDTLSSTVSVVFSSGGPMKASDALAWRRWVPGGVVEIYGSTETGGIAWRVQSENPNSASWMPFSDVSIGFEADGAIRVQSFRVGPDPIRMEDAGEALEDGCFRLLGRLDRIVKLEEKRVSLPELETELEVHPWISRAAVTQLEGSRAVLGAVVVLAKDLPPLSARERQALGQTFRRHLASRFELVVIPKRWRFVGELPYDERGKLTPQSLASLFAQPGV